MVRDYDKPRYIEVKKDEKKSSQGKESIKEMMEEERFGVLATNEHGKSYTSLISFAMDSHLTKLVFATPKKSKKFEMIKNNKNVSILIDNRANNEKSINDIAAITSLGEARVLEEKDEIGKWSKILIDKHSYLNDFINAETSEIILVDISKYYYVTSFQEVVEWNPNEN